MWEPGLRMVRPGGVRLREPSWFLIGAEKAGTSSAHAYLAQHPELLVVDPKEPHYYSHRLDHAEYRGSAQEDAERTRYLKPYQHCKRQVKAGDCSTSYLFHPRAAQRIYDACPDARILVLLRDPVERAWSHYLMNLRMEGPGRRAFKDIHQEHEWFTHGLYGRQLEPYVDLFGREQVFVQFTETMAKDATLVMERFARHLHVNPESMRHVDTSERHNSHRARHWLAKSEPLIKAARMVLPPRLGDSIGARLEARAKKPAMPGEMRERLQGWFEDDVERLQNLGVLDEPVPWTWANAEHPTEVVA